MIPVVPFVYVPANKDGESTESVAAVGIAVMIMFVGAFVVLFMMLGPEFPMMPIFFLLLLVSVSLTLFLSLQLNRGKKLRNMNCPACDEPNLVDSIYCEQCGKKL